MELSWCKTSVIVLFLIAEQAHEMEEEEKELEGFLFETLKQRYPELGSDLGEFKTHLKESLKEIVELKVWQLQGEL